MRINNIASVDELFSRLSERYQKARNHWDYDRDLYYMDHYRTWDEAKGDEERIQTNKATNVVDISHSILTLHPPKVTAQPITPSRRSDKVADNVEKFINGVLYVNDLRLQEAQVSKAIFDQVLYGRGAMFSGWNPELEGDDDEYSELPLVIRYVNHRNLYCLPGGNKRDIAQMYACWRTAEDLEAEWGKRISVSIEGGGRRRAEEDEELVYKDLWWYKGHKVWHCAAAGATWLRSPVRMPYYSKLPYTEFVGRGTTSEDLHLQYLGVLYPLREAIQILERWLNLGTTVVTHFADPPIFYDEKIKNPSMSAGATIPVRLGMGESITNKVFIPRPTEASAGTWRFIQIAEQMTEEGGFSRWAYANVEPESGPVVQGMNANDRVRLTVFKRNAELGVSSVIQKVLDCAYAFARDDTKGKKGNPRRLQVFSEGERSAISLQAKDLRGWLVTAKLSAKLPTDEARDIAIASNARQAGLPISAYTMQQRFLGIDQPADEERRLMVEQFMADPELRQAAKQIALAETNQELLERIAPGFGQPQEQVPNVQQRPTPTLPTTTAMHPQMFQEMPPEALQRPELAEPMLAGIAPGAPTGPQP